jgi:hypothetical protein
LRQKIEVQKRFKKKTGSNTSLKSKGTTYTLVFAKYLVVSFRSQSTVKFLVFLEDSLRIVSRTWCAGKIVAMRQLPRGSFFENARLFLKSVLHFKDIFREFEAFFKDFFSF